MIKILVIEDHEEMSDLIKFNMEQKNYEVICSADANDGLIHLENFSPDVILLDLMLPGLKGMDFLSIVRHNQKYVHIPVIIISAKNTENDIIKGLENGADDYLTKPFSMNILAAKVKAILRRTPAMENKIISESGITIDTVNYTVKADGDEVVLTNKEYELLVTFLRNPKRVFTRNQLLNAVWGYDTDVYSRTVDTHISSLRKKLGDKGKIIKSVPKIGYRADT
ncbi:response regulator transcription factor [Geovibrio sp. ADMFC3]|jgi:two-component system phosphate regulon response regulator PhoB